MKGFTLIELLITLAIVATILGIIYGSYASSVGMMNDCREQVGIYREARLVLEMISGEIGGAFVSSDNENFRFEGEEDKLLFSSACRGLLPGRESTDIREISYYLESELDRNSLVRREECPVDDDIVEDDIVEGEEILTLIDDLKSISFSYYGQPLAESPGEMVEGDWQEEWDWEEEGRLPRAVKVIIAFRDKAAPEGTDRETCFSILKSIPLGNKEGAGGKLVPAP